MPVDYATIITDIEDLGRRVTPVNLLRLQSNLQKSQGAVAAGAYAADAVSGEVFQTPQEFGDHVRSAQATGRETRYVTR